MPTTHHISTLLSPAWGHTVGYMHLALQMLKADSTLVVSILQHNLVVVQMEKELATCEYDAARLRILGVGDKNIELGLTAVGVMLQELYAGWFEYLPTLAQGSPGWPKPQSIHLDIFGGPAIEATTAAMGPGCKILLSYSSGASTLFANFNEYDFIEISEEIYADESRRAGRTKEEIQLQVSKACNGSDQFSGKVVKNTGVPDMYDYERVSHAAGAGPNVANWAVLTSGQKLAKVADGYILPSGVFLEPVGVPYLREFYKANGQELFTVGLQTHEKYFGQNVMRHPITNDLVREFLDDSYGKYGKNSVLYISFGSFIFPIATPKHVEALIDTLLSLDNPFPFVFALAGPMASLPQQLIDRVNSSGKGLICNFWVEQRAILQHEALGWFLTHGGFNSITESLVEGIPMIIWPASAEQPVNAAFFSAEPNPVAIELLQIRTGAQIGPSLRHGNAVKITGTVEDAVEEFKTVFADARGEKGQRIRANVQRMAKVVREGRAGEAAQEVERLAVFGTS
ncbi:hypothetical protein C8F01DRAFT_1266119 [Mycena amicta]|nr:hypothetical protein C8F01DRAFT_1266119 [Mycena amicta]